MPATSSRFHIRRTVATLIARRPHLRRRKAIARAMQPERPRRVRQFVYLSERLILGSAMSAGLLLVERRLVRSHDAHDPKTA